MNNNGFAGIVALMIVLTMIILALAIAPTIKIFVDTARNDTSGEVVGLNCSSSLISDFDKGACVATDLFMPIFIGFILIGSILVARWYIQ